MERWEELKAWDCDPWTHMEYFDSILSGEPPVPRKEKKVVHGFDPGHRNVSYSLFGGSNTGWLPAFSFLRLYEQVGIPLRLSGDTLKNASEWLLPFADFWSPSLLIRAGKVEEFKKLDPTNRTKIASMDPDGARRLHEWAIEALKREFSSLGGPIAVQSAQTSLLEVLIEAVSRLTLRLESDDLHKAFHLALALHRQPEFISHRSLNQSCEPWFRRLFQAADDRQLLEWLPDLIRFPFSYENIETADPQIFRWPDPMNDVPRSRVRVVRNVHPELLTAIHEATEWLLERAKSESGEGRQRAMRRLINVFQADLMKEDQHKELGKLLWERTGANGLPDLPDFYCFIYLHLPAPDEIDTVSRVKEYLLTLTPHNLVSIDEDSKTISVDIPGDDHDRMILEFSHASKPVVQLPPELGGKIEWGLDEINGLREKAIEWWENDKAALTQENADHFFGIDHILPRLELLGRFLMQVVLPNMDSASEDEWNKMLAFFSETRQHGVYLTTALPYALLRRPSEREVVIQTILDDLSLDNDKAVKASAEAIRHWIYLADADLVESPPPTAIDELISRVIFRRPEGIHACLQQLALLLAEKPESFSSDQVHLIVSSLTPWRYATCLPLSEERNGDFPEEERPELRVLLGRLASALSVWLKNNLPDQPEPSEIATLRKLYSSDPLPEVRRSFDSV